MAESSIPQPPQPPSIDRGLKFYPFQWIGVPILILIPLLALVGVFGETRATVESQRDGLRLRVDYTNRVHFGSSDGTRIRVTNTGSTPIEVLTLAIARDFLDNFSDLRFTPQVDTITEDEYRITLDDVQPGETRIVTYDGRGQNAGSHSGAIRVYVDEREVAVRLETWVIP